MKAVLQRVSEASVTVEEQEISRINSGLLILLGVENGDTEGDLEWLVGKIQKMRIFDDEEGKMNRSLLDIDGQALVVSQFTLHASTKKGNRPSFIRAAQPDQAEALYEKFCERFSENLTTPVQRGKFAAMMKVGLVNDGPVTIVIDSRNKE